MGHSSRLDTREYRYKNPTLAFMCPLCSTKRVIRYRPHLTILNYIQIIFISAAFSYFAYPLMGPRSFFVIFVLWAIFEAAVRILFKKEIPCPHCGFDAAWYKRDVKVTRVKVQEFWEAKVPDMTETSTPEHLGPNNDIELPATNMEQFTDNLDSHSFSSSQYE